MIVLFLNNNPLIKKKSRTLVKSKLNRNGFIFDYWSIIEDIKLKKKYNYLEIGN